MKISKLSIRDQVFDLIKKKILTKEYSLGQDINISELTREFSVSNTPIREALSSLYSLGLIEITDSKYKVVSLSEKEVTDLNNTILILLLGALNIILEKDQTRKLEELLDKAYKDHKEQHEYNKTFDYEYIKTSINFDRQFVFATNNKYLIKEFDDLSDLLILTSSYNKKIYKDIHLEDHKLMLECVKKNDIEGLKKLLKNHFNKKVVDMDYSKNFFWYWKDDNVIDLIKDAIELCNKKEAFVLASIIFKHGSAPREVGATMIITRDGHYSGTIGGGEQEYKSIEYAKELVSMKKCGKQYYEVSKEVAAESGMVCGGQMRVYFQYVDVGNEKNKEYFEKILLEVNDHNVYLLYDISNEDKNHGISIEIDDKVFPFTGEENSDRNLFKIKIKRPMKVFIFGGGHISKASVEILSFLGLNLTVVDDREDFIKQKEFDKAKRLVIDFDKLDDIQIEKSDYVLIMTRGHKYDIQVLESVLKKKPYYVGVVGNTIKAKKYREHFLGTDLENEYNAKVHLPVGMEIAALTPEEIAVSIAGEVIESYRTNIWWKKQKNMKLMLLF